MTTKLPPDYTCNRYGISFRLVTEEDASFILQLRTDEKLKRFIHDTDNDVNKQIEWIKAYKERESAGKEYYFVVSCDGDDIGVIRIYNIHEKTFTVGSIIMKPDSPLYGVLATTIIAKEIAFETLGMELEDCCDGVHVDNKQVIKLSLSWGKTEYRRIMDVKGEYIAFLLTKEDYLKVKPKKLRQLKLVMGEKLK